MRVKLNEITNVFRGIVFDVITATLSICFRVPSAVLEGKGLKFLWLAYSKGLF